MEHGGQQDGKGPALAWLTRSREDTDNKIVTDLINAKKESETQRKDKEALWPVCSRKSPKEGTGMM